MAFFLAGIIAQVITLVLIIVTLFNFQGDAEELWGLGFGIFFLIAAIAASLTLLLVLKTKIPLIVSIVFGLVMGYLIIGTTRTPEATSTVGLISGIAVGLLFIAAGIMARMKRV